MIFTICCGMTVSFLGISVFNSINDNAQNKITGAFLSMAGLLIITSAII